MEVKESIEDKLKNLDEQISILESDLNNEVIKWENIIKKLSSEIRGNIKTLPDVEADVINNKQLVDSDIRKYALFMYKENSKMKLLKKNRFEFYSLRYTIKLKNSTDIKTLTESDCSRVQYKIDLLNTHIEFLRDTSNNLKTMTYSFKNRIDLLNILGLD